MSKVKVKTADLTGAALDWAVAKATGLDPELVRGMPSIYRDDRPEDVPDEGLDWTDAYGRWEEYSPSTDWIQGGLLMESETISVEFGRNQDEFPGWAAIVGPVGYQQESDASGPTPLVAICRAVVVAKMGDEVKVPQELMEATHG